MLFLCVLTSVNYVLPSARVVNLLNSSNIASFGDIPRKAGGTHHRDQHLIIGVLIHGGIAVQFHGDTLTIVLPIVVVIF